MSEPNHPASTPSPESAGTEPADDAVSGARSTQPVAAVPPVEPPPAEPAAGHSVGAAAGRPPLVRRRPGPLTVMGPWAPMAGALLGLIAGIVAVLLLAGTAHGFAQRLSLVLLVLGLSMLGAATPLVADEVRVIRRGARDPAGRSLNGLTPARWVLLVSAFVLFLAAYTGR